MVKFGRQVHAQHVLMVQHPVPQPIIQVFHRAGTRLAILAEHWAGVGRSLVRFRVALAFLFLLMNSSGGHLPRCTMTKAF